jgi:dUTP pyrophosphatase
LFADANNESMHSDELLGEFPDAALGQGERGESIVIDLLHDDAQPPRRATSGSAGYDLCAYLTGRTVDCSDGQHRWTEDAESRDGVARVTLPAQAMALIPLGFKARLPNGYEAQIRPRSGAAFNKGLGIPNAPGTIDSDFPDEWRVIVRNTTDRPIEIAHGERIAQMVLNRYEVLPYVLGGVTVSTERVGGFGSTGH